MNKPTTTRERSYKQEKRIADTHGGLPTINSGATFGQNDVESKEFSIEAKTTTAKSYPLKLSELKVAEKKTPTNKIPVFQIDFEEAKKSYCVLREEDFLALIEELNDYRNAD